MPWFRLDSRGEVETVIHNLEDLKNGLQTDGFAIPYLCFITAFSACPGVPHGCFMFSQHLYHIQSEPLDCILHQNLLLHVWEEPMPFTLKGLAQLFHLLEIM